MPLVIGPGITIEPGINIEASNTPETGRSVAWTNNTYLDFGTARSGITTSNPISVSPWQSWQMCYAWQSVRVASTTSTLGFNTWSNDSSLVNWYLAIATAPNSMNFTASSSISYSPSNISYAQGAFVENSPNFSVSNLSGYVVQGPVTIPANRYFMIGMYAPSWRTWQPAAQNVTAFVGTTPYVTVLNTAYIAISTATGANPGVIPSVLGGTAPTSGNFITASNTVQVMSTSFSY